jgi:N12 class adenine-specific DNA methylase
VEQKLGRSGNITYVTSTGAFWGSNSVPGDIYEQIKAYERGELSDEQVRENYLAVLASFKAAKDNRQEQPVAEPITVADNVAQINYNMLAQAFPKIMDGSFQSMTFERHDPRKTLSISHDTTVAGNIHFEISSHAPNGSNIYEPSVTFEADFENRMLKPIQYVDTRTGVDIGVLSLPSLNDAARLNELSVSISEILSGITNQGYLLYSADVFSGADGQPLPAEPKLDIMAFLKDQADRQASAHFYVQQHMFGGTYPSLEALEAEFDRKVALMRGHPDYERIKEVAVYLKDWRVMTHRVGIAADALVSQINAMSDADAVKWFSGVPWDNWREALDLGDFEPLSAKIKNESPRNFRITDDHLGEGSAKLKFRNNIEAIKTLQNIEYDMRAATPEEQEIMSRYVGWGGLSQAFDAENKQWEQEYYELSGLLSPEDYESARASTLNSHYTSPAVIKAMYEAVERMGFKTGNILEPSCGVGNFFGLLPDSMHNSKLYGVEVDSLTARLAKHLYPQANIKATGFEKTDTPDAFFDLAIGNVPFGNYNVVDKRYDKHKFHIHDYFFAKALDQVRPGGVIAFVTSKYTMDKKNPDVRKYIAQRAEMLGAVRLPNDAFLKNAGTETTMDIIFLQKRDRPMDVEPEWVHLGMTEDGIPVNRYFLDNPEMMLGTMALDKRMNDKYGRDDVTACLPIEGADLVEQLKAALQNIGGQYTVTELDDIEGVDNHAIPADPSVKNFSYTAVDGTVYYRENSLMYPVELPAVSLERIKGMIGLRDCVNELIALQLDEHSDAEITLKQAELNRRYDRFTSEYGLVNSQGNSRAFNADSAYYLLCSLEVLDEDGGLQRKADMFTKRTIKQRVVITHVDTASEALAVSLGEKACVDIEYMAQLTGKDEETLFAELRGVVYRDFHGFPDGKYVYRTADEFLSGNVRQKLNKYQKGLTYTSENHPNYDAVCANIAALESAQPKDLDASEIAVRLGATWIAPEYVQQFMYELLKTSWRNQSVYQVKYHTYTGEWQVTGKGKASYNDVLANTTYGTSRMNAYQIIDDTLNLRDVRVYDYDYDADGKQKRTLNKKETTIAQQKQEQIKQAFKDWIWKDPTRRQTLVKQYNEKFNSVRPREYDGSHIAFSGISPEITMRQHQLNAVAHVLYGGNTLLAHAVGAGKTFEMVGAAMESKRLGLCNKSLFAVPNHLTEQWAGEFLRLYPSANILVATKKDFEMRNRKKFCAKIATGDYDAVIIGHSQLEKIPMSRERQERLLYEQLEEILMGIEELKESGGERFSIKQLEKTRKNLEARLAKLNDSTKRDDVVTFEQLGVDRLFIDEAHYFKNLFLYTKMRNVAGLSTSEAQKSSDLFMKCRYMDEESTKKHGRAFGTIFATGTPISNSMTEMYTMQRYLQYDTLESKNLIHFDSWASIFGETQTSIELAPEGTGYRARTRFSRFHNLPELMSMFKDVADIQTADMLKLPVPEAVYENIIVEPSELQKEMVQELSERAAAVHARRVEPNIDNMLKITTDGRKIGLDQRLMNPLLPDFEGSKGNACAANIFDTWNDTRDERLTQLVFCDFSTPNKDGRFNVYDDIRAKLVKRGIPEHEIAFIHDADTETRKKELFAKVRQGKVRVLFGSTFKMGTGTNVQDRLIELHDLDCPWRPSDLEQRSGRGIRQGNLNAKIRIKRYATNGTFDSYLWQTVQKKQEFIAQIMSSKSPVRSCEDVDETALSYAEIKALCAGNPLIAEKMNLDIEVAKLRMLKAEHQSQHYRLEDDLLKEYPEKITAVTERIEGIKKDIALYAVHSEQKTDVQTTMGGAVTVTAKFPGMTINGVVYTEKEPAAKALLEACKTITDKTDKPVGEYMGFKMSIRFEPMAKQFHLLLRGSMTYQVDLGTDAFGNITRINNALGGLPERLVGAKSQLENIYAQQDAAKQELKNPFALAGELAEKEARLALLNAELNIDGDGGLDITNDPDTRSDKERDNDDAEDEEYGEDEEEYEEEFEPVRVASYAHKGNPSFLDDIRVFNSERKPPVTGKKTSGHEL